MSSELATLSPDGLRQFQHLRDRATSTVSERLFVEHPELYERLDAQGGVAGNDDPGFHLEFLSSVLEFGTLQPLVSYLLWLDNVLIARDIPSEHLTMSLDWLAEFFREHMSTNDGIVVATALAAAKSRS